MPFPLRVLFVALSFVLAGTAALAQPSFMSILPAGQDGLVPAATLQPGAHAFDQLAMYRDLVTAVPGLEAGDLLAYFKDATIAAPAAPERIETPRPGVTIRRDGFGVPHVQGTTRADVFFGAGWVTGEDRLFLADALRHIGRGRFSAFAAGALGLDGTIGFDRTYYRVAGHSDAELQQQIDDAIARDPELGMRVRDDAIAFVEGLNAYIAAARIDPARMPAEYGLFGIELEDWKLTDVVASSIAFLTVIGFGNGGGGEHRNAELLQLLVMRNGEKLGTRLWQDLRSAENRDAPVTSRRRFPYPEPGRVDPDAVAMIDQGSFVGRDPLAVGSAAGAFAGETRLPGVPRGMSNWLAVTADATVEGRPILVGGPQTGYFAPQALIEFTLEGGGVNAGGATPPGVPYVTLGHTPDYAFTATAGGSDLVDVRVERFCQAVPGEPESGTLFDGGCVAIERRVDTWMAGTTEVTATVERTPHGIVIGRATVGGQPVLLARQRTSYGREIDSGGAFIQLNDNLATTPETFRDIMARMNGTLNWAYVSRDAVAYFHSGAFPRRAPGVDPDFPSWGTGEWEWTGMLPATEQPFEVNPRRGTMTSWNNKPARGWRAADDSYGWSSVYRSLMLDRRLAPLVAGRRRATLAQVVEAMADAATVDLRGEQILPDALSLAKGDPALDGVVGLLREWLAAGAHRIDRDGDGAYDHEAAVALMDEWYPRLVHAVFDPQLDGLYDAIPLGFDDAPTSHLGSAYQGGFYGHLKTALRQALGRKVKSRFRALRCAGGGRTACRTAVRTSLAEAAAALETRFGSSDPATWTVDPSRDEIRFSLGGLAVVAPIPWQNRPTFQQAVQIRD